MHGNPPEPPDMSRIELEDHYETNCPTWPPHTTRTLEALPMWQADRRRTEPRPTGSTPTTTPDTPTTTAMTTVANPA